MTAPRTRAKRTEPSAVPTEGAVGLATVPQPEFHATEVVPIGSLRAHPRNYRAHPEAQRLHVTASLTEHGFYRNIVVALDGTILAGHAVWEAAQGLGWEMVPVLRLPLEADSARALKVLAGDNELGGLADVDDRVLSEILKDIKEHDTLLGTGYDATNLAALLFTTRPASEIEQKDDAAAWVGMPEFQRTERPYKLIILFTDEEVRRQFVMGDLKVEQPGLARLDTWSMWWPPRGPRRTGTTIFDEGPEAAVDTDEPEDV